QVFMAWKAIIEQTGVPTIGLECGLHARFQTMGVLGYGMINSPTILKALEKFCKYQALVLSLLNQKIVTQESFIVLEGSLTEPWREEFKPTMDYILASAVTMIKNSNTLHPQPVEIQFNYPEPEDLSRYHEIFGSAILTFNSEKASLIYHKSDQDQAITLSNPEMLKHFDKILEELAQEYDQANVHSRAVKRYIQNHLKAEIPSIAEAANELNMSTRSLQDKLKKENTTFREILRTVQKELAMKYLALPHMNITDTAFLLGFSEVATFTNSFKKWSGLTPRDYKNQSGSIVVH
ncbi:MAG: AraC family transcriptional regulator ligand-binding domain-containing protein, partial [Bacteroidota bacterium]